MALSLAHQTGAAAVAATPAAAATAMASTAPMLAMASTAPMLATAPAPSLHLQTQTLDALMVGKPDLVMACQALVESLPEADHPDVAGEERRKVGVPVFVMMPLDTVRKDGNGLNRRKAVQASLAALKSAGVEGIMVDVWWGIAESEGPGRYNFTGYMELMEIARKVGLKVQAVMSFHQCGGNVGDSVTIIYHAARRRIFSQHHRLIFCSALRIISAVMKRSGDIASLFQKHEAKKKAAAAAITSNRSPDPVEPVVEEQTHERVVEEIVNPMSPPPPPQPSSLPPVYDINRLPHDPGERRPILKYHVNDQDAIRRAYITKGPFKPFAHDFPKRKISDRDRGFNYCWMYNHDWIEYSIKKDAVFCFIRYLFKKGTGSDTFTIDGWKNWNIGEKALRKHMGSKAHIAAEERYIGFINPKAAIDYNIEKWSDEDLRLYTKRLTYSLRCIKFLLHQGLAFRGHDESEESSNRGNFIELLKFLAGNSEEVNKYVLDNAPGNCTLTSPDIQKQIIHCCALETRKKIIEELGDEPYVILADESSDISHKEQLALCLRYVDKLGRPCERFIGVVHVDDTTSLSLKDAIETLLVSHGLTMTQIRGQGYDGASNMKGDIKGLKTLIMQESPSAYYIHCFAHQLQLVLVAVAKGNTDCKTFFDQISILLNIVGVSCKRHDMLRNARLENVKKALDCGEIESGTGLHQEMGLPRPGDARWGSHYKTICSIITMYEAIHDVLVDLGDDPALKDDWTKIDFVTGAFENFEFVFFAHLMYIVLGYTNELSECLQRRDQDILNAISLVNVAKKRMQELRSDGWDNFLEKVTSFCDKHGVEVPTMDGDYVPFGKSARKARARKQTNDDHFRREVYIGVIDQISQELDNRFDEINMELLSCMSAFNPSRSFASFDAQKLRKLAEFYPKEFSNNNLLRLELQLQNYIDDMRQDDSFKGLDNIVDLSVKLVETKRHKVYDMVYELLKLVLLLPVATASVERVFSAMVFVKTKTRNKMADSLLDDCLVTFIEQDIFFEVDEDDIIKTFMSLRKRRIKMSAK